MVLLWKLIWVKPPNCLIISWQIIHNGIPKELLLVKKVNSVEEISSLSVKVDALMKLVASKSAPIDFNDMPFYTLIEKNSDDVDVNFILRTILITMLIEVILILGLSLVIPLIIMVIPMEILLIIIIGTPIILRIILKNLSTRKKFSTLA